MYNIIISILLILNLCSFCFGEEQHVESTQSLDGFSLVQYETRGDKKWTLNGSSAEIGEDKVKIAEPSAVAFGVKGGLKLKAKEGDFNPKIQLVHLQNNVIAKTTDGIKLTTDSLYWNAEDKNIFTNEYINMKKEDFQVNGKGAICNLEDKKTRFKEDVVANIRSSRTDLENLASDTVITCDGPFDLNYKNNRATFYNNVKLKDPEGDVSADCIDVYFDSDTRCIKKVVANGNVKMIKEGNITYSEKAIYLVDEGRLVLPEKPRLVVKNEKTKY